MPLTLDSPIVTERLLLRRVAREDLPGLFEMNGDDRVTSFLPYPTWATAADGEAWFGRMERIQADGLALQMALCEKDSGRAIGSCLLFRLDEGSARVELGYALGHAHWGRGLMREALEAVIAHAFSAMRIRRIEGEVDTANAASAALLDRLGFHREGLLRQRWVNKGRPRDFILFGLLASDRFPG